MYNVGYNIVILNLKMSYFVFYNLECIFAAVHISQNQLPVLPIFRTKKINILTKIIVNQINWHRILPKQT